MIRKHFVGRIAELNKQVGRYYLIGVVGLQPIFVYVCTCCVYTMQVQDSDSKSSHYYAEVCCLQHWVQGLYMTIESTTVPSFAQAAEPQLSAENEASSRASSGH